jgi:PAS domain S-box-containing protein
VLTVVSWDQRRRFEPEDLELFADLAVHMAHLIESVQLRRTAQSAIAFQRGIFMRARDAMLLVDADGRYLDANPLATQLFGYSREELRQMRVGDLPVAGAPWSGEDRERFRREGYWQGEMVVTRKNGMIVPVEVAVSAIELADKTVYLSVIRDISARRTLDRVQRELTTLAAHELQGPRSLARLVGRLLRSG